jgi:hypothetical protein
MISNINKEILQYFTSEKHKNIKKSIVKKSNIVMKYEDVLPNLCFIYKDNNIMLDYRYFNCFIKETDYDKIFKHFYNLIVEILNNYSSFNIHIYIKSLSILDLEKYYSFISNISQIMKDAFPDKLDKCYIYNASFIFTQLIKIIGKFIDKKTQEKILLVDE